MSDDAGMTKLIDDLAEKLACAKDDAIIRGIVEAVREGRIAVQEVPADMAYLWGASEMTVNLQGAVRVVFPEVEQVRDRLSIAKSALRRIAAGESGLAARIAEAAMAAIGEVATSEEGSG
jgi:hypothetical protein